MNWPLGGVEGPIFKFSIALNYGKLTFRFPRFPCLPKVLVTNFILDFYPFYLGYRDRLGWIWGSNKDSFSWRRGRKTCNSLPCLKTIPCTNRRIYIKSHGARSHNCGVWILRWNSLSGKNIQKIFFDPVNVISYVWHQKLRWNVSLISFLIESYGTMSDNFGVWILWWNGEQGKKVAQKPNFC